MPFILFGLRCGKAVLGLSSKSNYAQLDQIFLNTNQFLEEDNVPIIVWRHNAQPNDNKLNDTRHDDIQYNDTNHYGT
jgi:hypothetical protein